VSSGAAPARESGNGEVHGNKKSKIYHLPDCPGYAGMNPTSVVAFESEAEAERAGYRKAKNCR
jgi:deoxyribonuclease I